MAQFKRITRARLLDEKAQTAVQLLDAQQRGDDKTVDVLSYYYFKLSYLLGELEED